MVILGTIFPLNLLTGAKRSAFLTNHLTKLQPRTNKKPKEPYKIHSPVWTWQPTDAGNAVPL